LFEKALRRAIMADTEEIIENEQVTDQEEAKKKSIPKKVIILVSAFLIFAGGGLYAWKTGFVKKLSGEGDRIVLASQPKGDGTKGDMGPVFSLDSFIVNLNEPLGKRYLKAKVTLELPDERLMQEVERRLPQFRDAILTMLSSKTYNDISDLTGKYQLRAEIISILNGYLKTGKIENVYFTEFIVQ
jgi:flagellar FliL protein